VSLKYSVSRLDKGGVVTVICPCDATLTAVLGRIEGITPEAFQPMPHDRAAALVRDQPETVRLPRANFPPFVDEDGVVSACPSGRCGVD
jgi:hypothetical protein